MRIVKILSCPCHTVPNKAELKAFVKNLISRKDPRYAVAINAEKVNRFINDKDFQPAIEKASLYVPDGSGAVIAMRILDKTHSLKIDFPKFILNLANDLGYSIFLLGGSEDSNSIASLNIKRNYPNVKLLGRTNGFFENSDLLLDQLRAMKPQIVLMGLGSPRQEFEALKFSHSYSEPFYVCCGGAIDGLAGKVPRAPDFFVRLHLEWFYRLLKQPSRFRRQAALPVFAYKVLKVKLLTMLAPRGLC